MPTATINGKTYPLPDNFDQIPYDRQQAVLGELEKQHLIVGPKSPDQFSGAVVPMRLTAEDKWRPASGLVGTVAESLYDFAKLPGDAVNRMLGLNAAPFGLGRREAGEPVIDPLTGRPSGAFTERAANFAGTLNLSSPGSIAGRRSMMEAPGMAGLKTAGSDALDAARVTGAEFRGSSVRNLVDDILAQQKQAGRVGKLAEDTRGTVADIAPTYGTNADIATLMAHRETLMKQAVSSPDAHEAAAAGQAVRAIDQFIKDLPDRDIVGGAASPAEVNALLQQGRGNWAAMERSKTLSGDPSKNVVSGILPEAELRAGSTYSGRNLDNAIRQRAAAVLRDEENTLGFSKQEIADLTEIAMGTAAQNKLRLWANRLGAGGGWGQASLAGGAGSAAGLAAIKSGVDPVTAGMLGIGVGGTVAVTGGVLKALENLLAKRGVTKLDEAVRLRSPLGEEMLARQDPPTSATGVGGNLSARDLAILRTLAPGLLAPPPPPAEEPSWMPGQRLPRGYI